MLPVCTVMVSPAVCVPSWLVRSEASAKAAMRPSVFQLPSPESPSEPKTTDV